MYLSYLNRDTVEYQHVKSATFFHIVFPFRTPVILFKSQKTIYANDNVLYIMKLRTEQST